MRKFFAALLACAVLAAALAGCGGSSGKGQDAEASGIKRSKVDSAEVQFTGPAGGDTIAVFDTSAGEIRAVLYPQYAPQACENFTGLAQQGFFNNTSFSKILSGFCVEGGLSADGAASTIWGGSAFAPETTDALHHYSGALCAAADGSGQCSSVFYFMQTLPESPDDELIGKITDAGYRSEVISTYQAAGGAPYLDYTDTVFGQVYSGMDIVDNIAQTQADSNGKPASDILINSVTISTY
ncbi:MAG: peptidylprolyl isomerase [Faecalibacterium sp.]|jgi:peptidyl-prolyl cis-trans isomerase B (cyclophilin B)|nr:peptidylprolyl isomerase [Faecalibacterium sp.]